MKLGYSTICTQWVSKDLFDNHKSQEINVVSDVLLHYNKEGESFLDKIVTGDGIWVQ